MKSMIRKLLPNEIWLKLHRSKELKRLKKEFKIDMRKFAKNSFIFSNSTSKRHLEGDLIFYYHKIEKGLALPNPRVGFGKKNVIYLISAIKRYVELYGWEEVAIISLNTLFSYYSFNKEKGLNMGELHKEISDLKSNISKNKYTNQGGVLELTKEKIDKNLIDFEKFAYSRYSIRNFSTKTVDIKQIENAVNIAQKTPSVCNRQPSKVYVYTTDEEKREILKYQNGNVGFGETADKVLIVTTNLMDFRGVIERNQAYIEGGLYSMSLIYGLHSQGLGTCALNLSITNDIEVKLKRTANIPSSEIPIMMIAVGHIPENLKVACSPRRSVKESMVIF